MSAFCLDYVNTRRNFLKASVAGAAWAMLPKTTSSAASADPRLMVIVLRGALDGLAAVAPIGDPDYADLRGGFELGKDNVLPLDGFFALNANMPQLAALYAAGDALIVHAVATDYRERSHFDGQDALESGFAKLSGDSGWLNRALAVLPKQGRAKPVSGVTLGHTAPLIMRGAAEIMSWAPQAFAAPDDDTVQRILALYEARDPELAKFLGGEDNSATDSMTGQKKGKQAEFTAEIKQAARFLTEPDGPRIAAMSSDGWDTHAAENPVKGRLATMLSALDAGIGTLKTELAAVWPDTVIVLVTEFGRTAAINGTNGTDHGTGGTAFLIGGAVKGGRVVADWPGLGESSLYEGRDLKPTTRLNAVFKGVLRDHLGVGETALSETVFPDSEDMSAVDGLVG